MKNLILATTLCSVTALSVVFYPDVQAQMTKPKEAPIDVKLFQQSKQHPRIELVFAIDTTGSMSGMIDAAKNRIWSIVTTLAAGDPAPEISVGLVAYRDRGDQYVTKTVDLSSDLDSVFFQLMQLKAGGGGDTPESVNQALNDAINGISWTTGQNAYQTVFLVGDAPAHTDYENDVSFTETLASARRKGIVVNTLQCGNSRSTQRHWQQIASISGGDYLKVEQNGNAIATDSPYDAEIAKLSQDLAGTRIFYGDAKARQKESRKLEINDELFSKAPAATLAKRAEFNETKSGRKNLLGENELLDSIESGKVDLDRLDQKLLPAEIAAMKQEEQSAYIKDQSTKRDQLRNQIKKLSEKRKMYVDEIVAKTDADSTLDYKLFGTLKKQAKEKGIEYESDDLSF